MGEGTGGRGRLPIRGAEEGTHSQKEWSRREGGAEGRGGDYRSGEVQRRMGPRK